MLCTKTDHPNARSTAYTHVPSCRQLSYGKDDGAREKKGGTPPYLKQIVLMKRAKRCTHLHPTKLWYPGPPILS